MEPQPVFVVGVPRSGTTLLAALLASHSRFAAGPETLFFSFWRGAPQEHILADPRWPSRAVAFLTSLPAVRGKVHEVYGRAARDLHDFLAARPPAACLLEALVQPRARAAGKARWVEKSPVHLLHVRDIRRIFPHAPIVRIVRDPRDVALSLRSMPWGEQSLLANAYRWQGMDRASWDFFATAANVHTVFYERLVCRPEEELGRLCTFLSEDFEPAMLDTRLAADGLAVEGEWWKDRAGQPLDPELVFAWRRGFPEVDRLAFEGICREGLERYGYEITTPPPARTHDVYALDARTVEACAGLLREAAMHGHRFLPLRYEDVPPETNPEDWPGPLLFLGDSLPGRHRGERWQDLRRLARTLLRRRLRGRPSLRLVGAPAGRPDLAARLAEILLGAGCERAYRSSFPNCFVRQRQ
jgi:hypothetical protein